MFRATLLAPTSQQFGMLRVSEVRVQICLVWSSAYLYLEEPQEHDIGFQIEGLV